MRMIFAAEGDESAVTQDEVNTFMTTGQVSETIADAALEESGGGVFDDKAFLDFDGDFSAILTDEDSKITVNNFQNLASTTDYTTFIEDPTYLALMGLFSTEENEQWFYDHDLDRTELIANLADWIDANTTRLAASGGEEDSLYSNLELADDYLSKNAPFDSLEEIREVSGWSDEVFDRFKDSLSVWGRGKINVCSISDDMLKGILLAVGPHDERDLRGRLDQQVHGRRRDERLRRQEVGLGHLVAGMGDRDPREHPEDAHDLFADLHDQVDGPREPDLGDDHRGHRHERERVRRRRVLERGMTWRW